MVVPACAGVRVVDNGTTDAMVAGAMHDGQQLNILEPK
jgi:phosphotransacetylase